MFFNKQFPILSLYIHFRPLTLVIFMITLVKSHKPSSKNNISSNDSTSSHAMQKPLPTFNMNYSSMKPVLFVKLHNFKLSHSIFRVTTFSSLTPLKCFKYLTYICPIKIGIFQGDSLSPLLFTMSLNPLSKEFQKTGYGYQLDEQTKINHLFYVDDLKLYGTSDKQLMG